MIVHLANKAGFCFGVKRAIDLAEKTAKEETLLVYALGQIVHNKEVIKDLSNLGIKWIDSLDEVKEDKGILLVRAHGEQYEVIEKANQIGLKIVDATCPFVKKAQEVAAKMAFLGKKVIIVGDKEHPEVKGIVSWSKNNAIVVKNKEEVSKLILEGEVGLLAQTTQILANFTEVLEELKNKNLNLDVVNTICNATTERQNAALKLSQEVDVMLVIGDKKSANTQKLTNLCRGTGTIVYQVETVEDIKPLKLEGVKTIGITAGASTPHKIIESVERWMKELDEMTEETMVTKEEEIQEESMSDNAVDVKSVRTGDVLTGVIVQISQDEVLVDVGAKSEGVIPLKELGAFNVDNPQELVKVGDEIEVYVLKAEDSEGRMILSKQMADSMKLWNVIQEKMDNGEVVEGEVKEVVKGGLLVDIGIKAFMPASLIERGYIEDLNSYVGKKVQAKVIELGEFRKKVILSRKVLLEEEYLKKRQEVLETIAEGAVVKGVVRRITNFGAFVDIGGIDGLLHVSEMSWHRINHPSEIVNVGDEIEVKVLKVDNENEKISLGLKQILPNPWDNVDEKYETGSIITATVVRLAPFGAFVRLEPGVEGLIHISHLANHHIEKPDEVVKEGEEIQAKVLSVDKAEKRIRLSIREINNPREKKEEARPKEVKAQAKKMEDMPLSSGDEGNVTLGDMFGSLFKDNK